MNSRIKFLIASIMFLSVATFCLDTFRTKAKQPKTEVAIQGQERLVMDKSRSNAPVKITLIKTKKRVVDNNKKFVDDDDWLEGLTLRVLNRSDKTVTYVGIQLIFRRTEDQESGLPAAWPLDYGFDPFRLNREDIIPSPKVAPIAPGSEIEITLSEIEHNEVKRFLAEVGFPVSRKRIELDIIKIGFSDGTAWNNGLMFRRDPTSQGPLKGWSLLDPPGNGKVQFERPKGSANRTAFFKKASFSSNPKSVAFKSPGRKPLHGPAEAQVPHRLARSLRTVPLLASPARLFHLAGHVAAGSPFPASGGTSSSHSAPARG